MHTIGNWACERVGDRINATNITSGEKLSLRLVPPLYMVALFGEEQALENAYQELGWGDIERAKAQMARAD